MKKINLSRRSKLFIGGIGSLAVLATIPAAVVACSSTTDTTNNSQVTQAVAQSYSQIQSSYTTTNATIAQMSPDAVNSNNIAAVVNEAGVLPTLSNSTWSYVFTANTPGTTNTTGILNFAVAISTGPYSSIKSPIKTIALSGFSTTAITEVPTTTPASFTAWVKSLNASFAANSAGQAILATTTSGSTTSVNSTITSANVLNYVSNLPAINYSGITIVAATPTVVSGSTNSLSVVLTFTGTNVPTNATATMTITGFMAATPSATQINQVQESLNNYILSQIVASQNLGIAFAIKTIPSNFVSSGATASSSQAVLTYANLLQGTGSSSNTTALAFVFPSNLSASSVNVTVSNNITPTSSAFLVTLQITGATTPGITVLVIANASNPAPTTSTN